MRATVRFRGFGRVLAIYQENRRTLMELVLLFGECMVKMRSGVYPP